MSGLDKAREIADKLRKEAEVEKAQKEVAIQDAKTQLAAIQSDPVLAQMYADNAKVGAENLGGELPVLKVHAVGKSSTNELADGSEPEDGYFFYKPTQEQFKEVDCHILSISRGFKALGMPDSRGKRRTVFHQIMGGVIVNGGEYKPFIIYLTGLKLGPMWDFGKEAAKYTRAKPFGIPMFALTVKLTTKKEVNTYGKSWVINFDIQKNEDGSVKLVSDPGEFQFYKDGVEDVERTIALIISKKEIKEGDGVENGDMPGDEPPLDAEY